MSRWKVWVMILGGCTEYDLGSGRSPGFGEGDEDSPGGGADPDPGTDTGAGGSTDPGPGSGTGTGTGTGTGGGSDTGGPPDGRGERRVDEAQVPESAAVDVLWVVDNSSSMGDDQDALATEFPTFIDFFQGVPGLDWHIGVVSTDMEDPDHQGRLREARGLRWLDAATPDPQGVFAELALMGTGGSGNECGRAPVQEALTTHLSGWNAGFVRPDATLAVVVVSDEDDRSSDVGVSIDGFVTFLRGFKPDPASVSFSTIVGDVPDGCPTADPGLEYPEVRAAVGGQFHSICSPDWDTVLTALAAGAAARTVSVDLTTVPDPATLRVEVREVDGAVVWLTVEGVEFSYDPAANRVTLLTYEPGPGATVRVHYREAAGTP